MALKITPQFCSEPFVRFLPSRKEDKILMMKSISPGGIIIVVFGTDFPIIQQRAPGYAENSELLTQPTKRDFRVRDFLWLRTFLGSSFGTQHGLGGKVAVLGHLKNLNPKKKTSNQKAKNQFPKFLTNPKSPQSLSVPTRTTSTNAFPKIPGSPKIPAQVRVTSE